ncbi:MAG: hypothetical protein JSS07_11400 [Proteobacteria bacterium]|nr:hypothetical protein [Pseudomonadota bacterium]
MSLEGLQKGLKNNNNLEEKYSLTEQLDFVELLKALLTNNFVEIDKIYNKHNLINSTRFEEYLNDIEESLPSNEYETLLPETKNTSYLQFQWACSLRSITAMSQQVQEHPRTQTKFINRKK